MFNQSSMSGIDCHSFGTFKSFTFNLKLMENASCGLQRSMPLFSFRDPPNVKSLHPKYAAKIAPSYGWYGKQQFDRMIEKIESHHLIESVNI